MKKRITQTDVVETMLLNNQLVTGSTVYKETKRLAGIASLNLHVLLRPLRKKYKVVGTWVTDKKGNRFKEWEIKVINKRKK
jgi:hypothetical protein